MAFLFFKDIIKKLTKNCSPNNLKFRLNSKSGLFIRNICSAAINNNAIIIASLMLYRVFILNPLELFFEL